MPNIIDTRELQERLDELEALRDDVDASGEPWTDEDREELEKLEALRDEIGPEFPHGETMILASEFEDYAREFAEDIGAIDGEAKWPNYCIDWEYAARELRHDYSLVVWDGYEYLVRSS